MEMEAEMEVAADFTAKAIEPVPEAEADSMDKVTEIGMETDRMDKVMEMQMETVCMVKATETEMDPVMNLARQAPWRWRQCHSHLCHPVAHPHFRCRSRGHPPCLGVSTDLRHIAPVVISPTAGQSCPLSFISVMLLACPSPVIITYVVSC